MTISGQGGKIKNLQNGQTVVLEKRDLLVPARRLERGRVAPRVVVKREEVAALVIGSAVHELGRLVTVARDISRGVADRDLPLLPVTLVLLHVTRDGFDVWSGSGRGSRFVDNLVSGEEGKGVVVLREHVHGSEDALEVRRVVGWAWVHSVERVERAVHIENKIDARIIQSGHASIMTLRVVDRVDTNGVDAKLLEILDVSCACRFIGERVCELRRST